MNNELIPNNYYWVKYSDSCFPFRKDKWTIGIYYQDYDGRRRWMLLGKDYLDLKTEELEFIGEKINMPYNPNDGEYT